MIKKLSICMIVKDEEKNLQRCLDSLKPLLETNYTELIIVDTGSKDSTVDIAKEYTQRVYFHEWNGNFSDMRNISISYATGEWIFIMDADEELETPNELINLLEGSKIKKIKTVKIKSKSLVSLKLNKYVYMVQERLFRNDGAFKYRGSIHNQPVYQHPVLTADIEIMHYGYINDDKDLMEKKFKRTASTLQKELEKNPEDVYYRFQLARSYMMHGDTAIALEEITKAYESMKKQPKELIAHMYYVFGEYARMSLNAKKYKQVIDICRESLTYTEHYPDLYYYMGHAYLSLEEYKKGIESLEKYMEYYRKYNNNELDLSHLTAIEAYTLDEKPFESTLNRLVSIIYKEQLLIKSFMNYKFWLNQIKNKILKSKLLVKIFMIEKEYDQLLNLYKDIEDGERYSFTNYLEYLKRDLGDEEKVVLERLFSTIEGDYGFLNRIRIAENRNKLLIEFINNYDIIEFSDQVIIEFVKYLIESNYLNRFFKKLDSVTIKKIVKVLIDKEDKMDYFLNSLCNDYKFNDFQNNRIYMAIANVILLSIVEEKGDKTEFTEELIEIFGNYINKGIEYIMYIYNIDRIRLTYSTFTNREEKFFALLYLANSALQKENIQNHNKLILEAIEVYPYLSSLLKTYVSDKLKLNL